MTQIISLFSGPGAGKSTCASYVFSHLKILGFKCELLTEFAKSIVYQKRHHQLLDQQYIHAKQVHYLNSLINQVDYVITDSPSLLSAIYSVDEYYSTFIPFVLEVFNSYNNINFFIQRIKQYQQYGRNQTLEEAIAIDNKIYKFLETNNIPFSVIPGNEQGYRQIINCITTKVSEK